MEFIGIKNFKAIVDYQHLYFAPITLLTGPNNSGKSSVLKAILLLKNNFHTLPLPIALQLSEYSQRSIGSNSILNANSKNNILSFVLPCIESNGTFSLKWSILTVNYLKINDELIELDSYSLYGNDSLNPKSEHQVKFFEFKFSGSKYFINIDLLSLYSTYLSHGKNTKLDEELFPIFELKCFSNDIKNSTFIGIEKEILSVLSTVFSGKKWDYDIKDHYDFYWELFIINFRNLIKSNLNSPAIKKRIAPILIKYNVDSLEITRKGHVFFEKILDLLTLKLFYFPNVTHVKPDRTNQRTFFNLNDTDELSRIFLKYPIDNINSARMNYLGKVKYKSTATEDWDTLYNKYNFVNLWLKNLGICSSDEFFYVKKYAKHSCEGLIENSKTKTILNIADYGFGTNQLIAMLLLISNGNQTILLEEPETNLHPDFQSRIADILIDARNKFETRFIVETHSEYLIRKLQYLVANKDIPRNDVLIHYFNRHNKPVSTITLDKTGALSEPFGEGFTDEAITWKFELLKLQKAQKN